MKVLKKDKNVKTKAVDISTSLDETTIKSNIDAEKTDIKRKLFQKKEVDNSSEKVVLNNENVELNENNNPSNIIENTVVQPEYLDKELDHINSLFEDAQHDEDFYQLKISEDQYDKWLGRKTVSLEDFNQQFKDFNIEDEIASNCCSN